VSVERKRAGYLEAVVSIVVNTILFIVKYVFGVMFNSIAVIADAFHTLSDSLTSIAVLIGFYYSYRPSDKEHPFGHGRAELIASIVIGVMLGYVGYSFAVESYNKLINRQSFIYSLTLVIILIISTVVKEGLALWAFRLGKKVGSRSIEADAWHHRSDAIATALLAIAFLIGWRYWWIDSVLGLVVSAIIIVTAVDIVLKTSSELLGKAPTKEELYTITKIVSEISDKIKNVHHIHIHRYGDHTEVTLHIDLPGEISLSEAHRIATEVEQKIREELGYEATVHTEPVKEKEVLENHKD